MACFDQFKADARVQAVCACACACVRACVCARACVCLSVCLCVCVIGRRTWSNQPTRVRAGSGSMRSEGRRSLICMAGTWRGGGGNEGRNMVRDRGLKWGGEEQVKVERDERNKRREGERREVGGGVGA
jgi:hypothetical protein